MVSESVRNAVAPWRRSSSCPDIDCVEVQVLPDAVLMRDSKSDARPLRFTVAEWSEFLHRLRNGPIAGSLPQVKARMNWSGVESAGG